MRRVTDVFDTEKPFEAEHQSGDDEEDDSDVCNAADIEKLFNVPYHLEGEISVAMQKTYILHTSGSLGSNPKVAVGLSDYVCAVYDVEHLTKLHTLPGHKTSLVNVKFSSQSEHLLYSGSVEGIIKLWDLRTPDKCIKEFKDDTDGSQKLKPIISFDVAVSDQFVCAGTELVDGDAFLLFWDIRSSKLLGGYWESHINDITQVCFHPSKQETVATGSTDGLMNVFNISMGCEDDALLYSLNTESSVEKIGWFFSHGGVDALSCITHTHALQLWRTDDAAPFAQFQREEITQSLQRKCSNDCYLVDVHQKNITGDPILLAGSTAGRGECLRTLQIQQKELTPLSTLVENKQIVRSSWYDKNNELVITGGESGLLNVWKPGPAANVPISSVAQLKIDSRVKHKTNLKPY